MKGDDCTFYIKENKLEKHKHSDFHIGNHIKKETCELLFCDICALCIRKLNQARGLTPAQKRTFEKTFCILKNAINQFF